MWTDIGFEKVYFFGKAKGRHAFRKRPEPFAGATLMPL